MFSALALLIVGVIAALSLSDGFSGDQALFLIYSKAIDNGAILYRDVWDIKQPAIFVFFLIAGKSFGFTEIGIHLFEFLYWLCFCLVLLVSLKKYFVNPLFAALTPLFTIGIYYTVSGSVHFTQVEALVGFPLFASLWFCQKFLENPEKKSFLFLSGLFGGIVLTFKLLFAPLIFAFWILLFVFSFRLFEPKAKRILSACGLILLGLIIPIAAVVFYFAANDALGDLWYTTFVYPYNAIKTVTEMENRSGYLKDGLEWFFKSYFPVIALTLILLLLNLKSLFGGRRGGNFTLRREEFLFSGLFVWVIAGFAIILAQKLSWWAYHYSLLMIPLGILATKCLERFYEETKTGLKNRRRTSAYILLTCAVALFFVPTARRLAHKIRQSNQITQIKIEDRQFGVTGDAVSDYESISADTAFLQAENPKASIFVVSNPLYYYLSGTPPVFSSNGAMSDMFTEFEWARLDREMALKPPKYVFIETRFLRMIGRQSPNFINTINKNYTLYAPGGRGSFYKMKE
ncbi:MAG TPA: hypothetical protein VF556_03420 [Pyrinomonadaceae bacterium]